MFRRWRARTRQLRSNKSFEWFTISVIVLSSMSVGVKSYDMAPLIVSILKILDWLVTLYFLAELVVRFLAAGSWRSFFSKGWNIFDFLIVTASLIPVDESEYALLARLLRLFRMMRLIYFVPQLRLLVNALLLAVPRMAYVALMMFVIFYIYGAAGNLFFADVNEYLWGNVGRSMLTLFRVSTFEDWTDVMYETMEIYPLSWTYYLSFIFLSAFVFLNMMIGVIINVLQEEHDRDIVNAREKERLQLLSQLTEVDKRLQGIEAALHNKIPPP
ncbi:ion transporter [Candidatus Persebacteraceae bacterium Df01]|uniref:Ion transporter n=1 Tax=Candidatus Doriopsillibacter californiensis TaxID=2970740 RepID=A0ABT7QMV9_9GAMM|nr:ion transporter [Candidatus Persebacteraceae bacterium Df01]